MKRTFATFAIYLPAHLALNGLSNLTGDYFVGLWGLLGIVAIGAAWFLAGRWFPSTASFKFSGSGGGHVYLMRLKGQDITKLGITKNLKSRVGEHKSHGWQYVTAWTFPTIEDARNVERAVHQRAARMGALPKDKRLQAHMPQGGYTEVMTLSPQRVSEIVGSLVTVT